MDGPLEELTKGFWNWPDQLSIRKISENGKTATFGRLFKWYGQKLKKTQRKLLYNFVNVWIIKIGHYNFKK